MKKINIETGRSKYNGVTRKQYKRIKAKEGTNSTSGTTKAESCRATGLDKAMAKYPRAINYARNEYINFNIKKDKHANRTIGFFAKLKKEIEDIN